MKKNILLLVTFFLFADTSEEGKKYGELLTKIKHYDQAYYLNGENLISDEDYDKLVFTAENLLEKNPQFAEIYGLRDQIGSDIDESETSENLELTKNSHLTLIETIDKIRNVEELEKWLKKEHATTFIIEPKLDGVSINAYYKNGELEKILSRGDGKIGNDLTEKLRKLVPENVPNDLFFLRGELIVKNSSLEKINAEREAEKLSDFSSCRSAAAGIILNRKDTKIYDAEIIFFKAIFNEEKQTKNATKILEKISKFAPTIKFIEVEKTSFLEKYIAIQTQFESEDLPIDGLIVQNKDDASAEKVAIKFITNSQLAEVKEIVWNVSRLGVLTPVAGLKSVKIDNVEISRVLLYNAQHVINWKIMPQSIVKVIRAGKTIPQIIAVESYPQEEVTLPKNCFSCQKKLVFEKPNLICPNEKCPERNNARLSYFFEKNNIPVISSKQLSEIKKKQKISHPFEILLLDEKKWQEILPSTEKGADKKRPIVKIEDAKKYSLARFITALGIGGIGRFKSANLAEKYTSISEIIEKEPDNLVSKYFSENSQIDKLRLQLKKLGFKQL